MGRTILIQLGLFLAPFGVYALVLTATKKSASEPENWPLKTVLTLATIGCVLVIAGLVLLSQFGGAPPTGVYEPARYQDGKLIPGRIK